MATEMNDAETDVVTLMHNLEESLAHAREAFHRATDAHAGLTAEELRPLFEWMAAPWRT